MIFVLRLEMSQRLLRLLENLVPPVQEALAEILPLALAHEGFFVVWTIVLVDLGRLSQGRGGRMTVLLVGTHFVGTHRFPVPGSPCCGRAYIAGHRNRQ